MSHLGPAGGQLKEFVSCDSSFSGYSCSEATIKFVFQI